MATILIVEDDPVSQKLLYNLLDKRGHNVFKCEDVNEAFKLLREKTVIDLVVLDNQLRGEYGWQLVKNIREDFVFQHLPVVLYTATSDRSSIIKYMQLGVQKVLLKPYNNVHLEKEIETAQNFNWREKIFEPVDLVCSRLEITEDEYYTNLSQAAEDLLEFVPQLNRQVGLSNSIQFDEILSKIDSMAVNLGISILENACQSIIKTLRKDQLDKSVFYINHLISAAHLMRHRTLTHYGMEDDTNMLKQEFKQESSDATHMRKAKRTKAANDNQEYLLQSPINAFSSCFKVIADKNLLSPQETLENIFSRRASPSIATLKETLKVLSNCDKLDKPTILQYLGKSDSLKFRLNRLMAAMGQGENHTIEAQLDKLGIAQSLILYFVNQLKTSTTRERNPLFIEPLLVHTLSVSMSARELSRKFSDTHHFAMGGALYNIGKWILLLQYPGIYGMALSLGNNNAKALEQAERSLFGMTSQEVGAACMRKWKIDSTYMDLLLNQNNPKKIKLQQTRIYGCIIDLANAISHSYGMGYNGAGEGVDEKTFIESSAWRTLEKDDISIPLKPDKYYDVFKPVMERIRGQINAFME